ncbi:hypothetical protein EVJ58_g2927 [Rhodofomes roseus]|uniref:Uncharacterized protein n=1 Tax=Rhodofomes roseus TaxID=34475 RepID=A0A4Y9YQ76_9APHY|nr:hypothetical protein EVJ58_g2927 [Rhodofomes roseus]
MDFNRTSLSALPSELIWDILQNCQSSDSAHRIPKRYCRLNTVLRIDRRLRGFCTRLMLRELVLPSSTALVRVLDQFQHQQNFTHLANEVRTIQIGRLTDTFYVSQANMWKDLAFCLPFRRLRSFSCWDVRADVHALALFWLCPDMTTFELVWDQKQGLPDFRRWPLLTTLRLHFTKTLSSEWYPSVFPPYEMLTTLMVFEEKHSHWLCGHMQKVTFPRLRVLNLELASSHPRTLYQFIHRHPTLMEVNISLAFLLDDNVPIFAGLLKLIDGTGNWGNPNDSGTSNGAVDIVDPHRDHVPHDGAFITFRTFAFTRVPLSPRATEWRDSSGSAEPRYAATGLAIEVEDQDDYEQGGHKIARFHDFMDDMAPLFPQLEVLRLGYRTDYWHWSFCDLMQSCAASLRKWPRLRKLSFCCGDMDRLRWRAGDPMHFLGQVEPPVYVPYMVSVDGMDDLFARHHKIEEGAPFSLEQLRLLHELADAEVAQFIEDIQDVLNETVNPDEVMHDPHLPMRVWQTFCERQYVAPAMRALAEACPTLEEIEWYLVGPYFVEHAVRWLWKVYRERDGKGVRRVTGELTYRGSPRGDAQSFDCLLGQELDHHERQRCTVAY